MRRARGTAQLTAAADLAGIAARYELPLDLVRDLAEAVRQNPGALDIITERSKPELFRRGVLDSADEPRSAQLLREIAGVVARERGASEDL